MKLKITAALLACFMLLAAATACNKDKESDDTKSNIPVLSPGSGSTTASTVEPASSTAGTTTDPGETTTGPTETTKGTESTTSATTTTTSATTAKTTTTSATTATTKAPETSAPIKFTDCNDLVYVTTAALNVRTSPEVKADNIFTQVKEGDVLTRTGYSENWYRIAINGTEYYVSSAYVSEEDPNAEIEFAVRYETVYVTANSLYIREKPHSSGAVYAVVTQGTELVRVGYHETWSRVMYDGKLLYCGSNYLSTDNPNATETTTTAAG